ncbi:protein RETICULATA-RELATED 3, chloroplastic-like [Silene latifolia]|uniref:protein RETICULATA-RELATED 3, chloroplastic-like n=1 Tax=Silene latifolia TaxID=37657 RepID=UPI003D77F3A2
MSAVAQLRYSSLPTSTHRRHSPSLPLRSNLSLPSNPRLPFRLSAAAGGGGAGNIIIGNNGGNGGGGHGGDSNSNSNSDGGDSSSSWFEKLGLIGMFIKGWRERVAADPQFPFKVLMEEVVGVTSCVIGDMASRPNFGLNELDFVFSTLIVGSILNFTLMYLLAPSISSTSSGLLPGIFATCPPSHMFEPGNFPLVPRLGTFVYKGLVFAAVGFAAGLVGTAVSNGLIAVRKKMDPEFETPNKPPPTLLNATTWALHMGLSSNFRYQALNGVEFLLAKAVPAAVFKSAVVVLRCGNNVLGGMSFVALARLTGSQSVTGTDTVSVGSSEENEKENQSA